MGGAEEKVAWLLFHGEWLSNQGRLPVTKAVSHFSTKEVSVWFFLKERKGSDVLCSSCILYTEMITAENFSSDVFTIFVRIRDLNWNPASGQVTRSNSSLTLIYFFAGLASGRVDPCFIFAAGRNDFNCFSFRLDFDSCRSARLNY